MSKMSWFRRKEPPTDGPVFEAHEDFGELVTVGGTGRGLLELFDDFGVVLSLFLELRNHCA